MAMNTAYDFKKLLKTIYDHNYITNGEIIDCTAHIDNNTLFMLDELESTIAYEADLKEIPIDIIVNVLREDGFFEHNLSTAIHNYNLIQKKASSALMYLDKLQKLMK